MPVGHIFPVIMLKRKIQFGLFIRGEGMKILGKKNIRRRIRLSEEEKACSILSVAAYNPDNKMFITLDNEAGFAWLCEPICYEDENILERIKGFLNDEFPKNTIIQFCLFRSPDISLEMYALKALRRGGTNTFLKQIINQRVRFIKKYSRQNLVTRSDRGTFDNGIIQDLKLVITVKCPVKGIAPDLEEETRLITIADKVQTSLSNLNLYPLRMDQKLYIRFMQVLLNRSPEAGWRRHRITGQEVHADRLISEQIFDRDCHLSVHRDYLRLGRKNFMQCLSARRLPESMWPGDALNYIGDITNGLSNIKANFLISFNVYYPNAEQLKPALERKRQMVVNQSMGPLVRFVPILARKQEGFDILDQSMQSGYRPLRISYTVTVMGKSRDELTRLGTTVRNLWREQHFDMMVDDCCQLPCFINALPLCADSRSVRDLFLYFTITAEMAAPMIPIMGEWKGTGTFHMALFSRNGQLMSASLHDSQTNKNAVIAAESGSGKSFFANELLLAYLSEGAQIWVIDAGKSYKKLAEILHGDFLQFDESSSICLNPFALIYDYTEDEDAVVSLIQNMASASNSLDEFQVAGLKRIMSGLWSQYRNRLTIDLIAEQCLAEDDKRLRDLGAQLFPFTAGGSYGRYFNGSNTIDFKNDFTVLELDELNGRRHLRQVVLLQLIYQIQQQVFLGSRSRKKIILIDEAWDLLKDGDVAVFMEHAYRKFRKYGGSAVIATQSINDLYNNSTGQAIAENSATMFLLGQTPETVESIKKSGRLAVSEGCYELLKTVHTMSGVYSEIFIKSANGMGIGRLIVSEFQKLLYSTSAGDVAAITHYTDQGLDVFQAINSVLRDRGITSETYEQIDEEYLEEERTDLSPVQLPENRDCRAVNQTEKIYAHYDGCSGSSGNAGSAGFSSGKSGGEIHEI